METLLPVIAIIAALLLGIYIGNRRAKQEFERKSKPMPMIHMWGCKCGYETTCQRADVLPGAVFECPKCSQVWGHLTPGGDGRAWVKISEQDVSFHNLLRRDHLKPRAVATSPNPQAHSRT